MGNDRPESSVWPRLLSLAVLALALWAGACGEGEGPRTGGLSSPGDLRGTTIGVPSLDSVATLEARYVLQQKYKLHAAVKGGDVALMEAPAESLPTLLRTGEVDAALLPQLATFRLLSDEDFRVLSHLSEEMRELTDAPVMNSILVTYADVAAVKRDAIADLSGLLDKSLIYFKANQDAVIDAVAADRVVDPEFLGWWWERHDLVLGDRGAATQGQILDVWNAARAVGDIEGYPDLAAVLFGEETPNRVAAAQQGSRTTVSLAVLDDPSRRAALYAIEQGIVTSDAVDLNVSYLPQSALNEVTSAKQYDVVEATPLVVPLGSERGLDLLILSGGLLDLDGTLLFVGNTP